MVILSKKYRNTILLVTVIALSLYTLYTFNIVSFRADAEQFCGDGCGEMGYPYGYEQPEIQEQPENFSSCYRSKQIYLNSCDPDQPSGHADVNLERKHGRLYININANLPYAKGGVFNTMWGAYSAYLVDTRNNKSINLGSLVRDGSRFYKLRTELLGEYSNYDEISIYHQVEDYKAKKVISGSINCQSTSEEF